MRELVKEQIVETTAKKVSFGVETILDLYDCNLQVMRSEAKLREYVDKLCELLKMEKYGECLTPYFGLNNEHTAGYSLLQFIETSSITGHFAENTGTSYINIFSCGEYDPEKAAEFTRKFFGAKKVIKRIIERR
ncbi:S-adenosylmethionine decarboxylase [bacterium]|jgi:S-adenosylmethionine/arginine decarboxylase-like enzyme|nr:S-adenosylmethionine decarboxylase [bacterium]